MTAPERAIEEAELAKQTVSFTVRLSPDAVSALHRLAAMHGWSTAAEARSALRAHLERYGLGEVLPPRHERARDKTAPSGSEAEPSIPG